jgi:excisionase family DNA binding protein
LAGLRNYGEWLTLSQASDRLGIAGSTLRRWADSGRLVSMTTLGGHRRFPRAVIEAMLPATRARRPSITRAGATPEHIARAYRAADRPASAWLEGLDDAERGRFRRSGRKLVALIVGYLDATDAVRAARWRARAQSLAEEYGARASALGISLSDTISGFLAFRRPFLAELAAAAPRRSLDSREAALFVLQADAVLDELLAALMRGYSER